MSALSLELQSPLSHGTGSAARIRAAAAAAALAAALAPWLLLVGPHGPLLRAAASCLAGAAPA